MFGLSDGDPHGLDIVRVYRNHVVRPELFRWLGLQRSDAPDHGTWLPLTQIDRLKAVSLLKTPNVQLEER